MSGFSQSSAPLSAVSHTLDVQIPEVSLVNVVGSPNINLAFKPPLEAGNALSSFDVDSSFWINYSFIKVGISRSTNHIYARITDGFIPFGVALTVYAKPYQGLGQGGFGIPSGLVQLGPSEQRVIENISSCFTGTGIGNGHQLVYQLNLLEGDYNKLDFEQSQQVSVLYTISD